MNTLVLDSYALLVWLLDQPKADVVQHYLDDAASGVANLLMSWINVGEVSYMMARKAGPQAAEDFLHRVSSLPVRLMVPDVESILGAARIKAKCRVAYADAFAMELAIAHHATVVTGDPEIQQSGLVPLSWIGPG